MSDYTYTVDSIGDDSLTDSIIMRTVTEVIDEHITTIRDYAFYECEALKTMIGTNVTKLGERCFSGCTALETVSFPKLSVLCSGYVFNKCSALEKIDLNCTRIGYKSPACSTFYGCTSLKTLILRSSTVCSLGMDSDLSGTPILKGTGYIYVPQALIESYRASEDWSTFADQFRSIEDYSDICG